MGGTPSNQTIEPQDFTRRGYTTRLPPYHFGPVVSGVPRCRWNRDCHASKRQRHHGPYEAVREIGKVLPSLLRYAKDTPAGLHIIMSKLDIRDGFWRLIVRDADCFNFAYVLPQQKGEPCMIVVPSAVQMGWVESPSLFCAVTETARNLAQHFVDAAVPLPPHQVEGSMTIEDVPM
jgi:hypothetical protein